MSDTLYTIGLDYGSLSCRGVLAALGAEEYLLPETAEPKTPIGVKLVFERWLSEEGKAFYDVSLVYQSTEQLREASRLSRR